MESPDRWMLFYNPGLINQYGSLCLQADYRPIDFTQLIKDERNITDVKDR